MNNHIKKILHKSDYILSETAKYHPVLDEVENDDILPDEISKNIDSPEDKSNDDIEIGNDAVGDNTNVEPQQDAILEPTPKMSEPQEVPDTQESIDKVQNEILKLNLETMKKVQTEIDSLNSKLDELSNSVGILNQDVEEVKEPTDIEKLTSRKIDSHPYYMNLNDMWYDGAFQGRRDQFEEKNMKKLDDGTYIADFDTIKSEFNNYHDL